MRGIYTGSTIKRAFNGTVISGVLALVSLCTPPLLAEPPDAFQVYGHGGVDAALVQTFNGMMLSIHICEAQPGCHSDEETASLAIGALAGSLGGYVIGSQFARGHVMMVNTGTIFGTFGGVVSASVEIQRRNDAEEWNFDQDAVRLQHIVVGELLGGLAFGGLSAWLKPTPAQVSLANSGGWWALFLGGMGQVSRDQWPNAYGSAATFGAGFAAAWMLWDELKWARISTWQLDLGGVVGAIGGALWAQRATGSSDAKTARAMMVGTLLGLGTGAYMAAGDGKVADPRRSAMAMALMPRKGGAVLSIHGGF